MAGSLAHLRGRIGRERRTSKSGPQFQLLESKRPQRSIVQGRYRTGQGDVHRKGYALRLTRRTVTVSPEKASAGSLDTRVAAPPSSSPTTVMAR